MLPAQEFAQALLLAFFNVWLISSRQVFAWLLPTPITQSPALKQEQVPLFVSYQRMALVLHLVQSLGL
jgi:hypothetical protein